MSDCSRVAELEQENARLLALAQNGGAPKQESDSELLSEVEQLRAQLAAVQKREQELSEALSRNSTPARSSNVKSEAVEPSLAPSRNAAQMLNKSSASLGLMVCLLLAFRLPRYLQPYALGVALRSPDASLASDTLRPSHDCLAPSFDLERYAGCLFRVFRHELACIRRL